MRRNRFVPIAIVFLPVLTACGHGGPAPIPDGVQMPSVRSHSLERTLQFRIPGEALRTIIIKGLRVTIVKQVDASAKSAQLVAWQAFGPLENVTVTWKDDYVVYSSTAQPEPGSQIFYMQTDSSQARPGTTYTYADYQFNAAQGSGAAITIRNKMRDWAPSLGFGLAQKATVNGVQTSLQPASFATVKLDTEASFTPEPPISIFLSKEAGGTIIGAIPKNALTIELTPAKTSAEIGYRPATETFYVIR